MLYLGVDLGSSYIKGAVLDLDALTIQHGNGGQGSTLKSPDDPDAIWLAQITSAPN